MKTDQKELTLYCVRCGIAETFSGKNIFDIMRDIDILGWTQHPRYAICPECNSEVEKEKDNSQ